MTSCEWEDEKMTQLNDISLSLSIIHYFSLFLSNFINLIHQSRSCHSQYLSHEYDIEFDIEISLRWEYQVNWSDLRVVDHVFHYSFILVTKWIIFSHSNDIMYCWLNKVKKSSFSLSSLLLESHDSH